MSNKFSFSDEAQQRIIRIYQEALEETNQETRQFTDNMYRLCDQTKFLPIVNAANATIQFYNESLSSMIKEYYQGWLDSESSLHSFIQTMEGGDDAIATAKLLESGLEDVIVEMFAVPLDLVTIDTATPDVSDEDYDILKEHAIAYYNKINGIKEQYLAAIISEGEDNSAFLTIQAVVTQTMNSIIGSFEAFAAGTELLRDDFVDKLNRNSQNADDVNQSMSSVAERSADTFKGLSGMLKL